jgi:hypothetical protein
MRNITISTHTRHLLITAVAIGIFTVIAMAIVLSRPWQSLIDIGDVYDHPFVRNFYTREYSSEHEASFRWTQRSSVLVFPGVGDLAPLSMRVHGDYPGMTITVDGGTGEVPIALRSGWQHIALLPKPPSSGHWWSGDRLLSITAPVQTSIEDERERGVVVDMVTLSGQRGTFPLGQPLLLGLITALATVMAGWARASMRVGGGVGIVSAVMLVVVLSWERGVFLPFVTVFSGRFALVIATSLVLGVGLQYFLRWLAAKHVIPQTEWLPRALAVAGVVAFLLRFTGMAYPLTFISDIRFSMARASMVWEGDLLDIFLPNPALTPVQWDMDVSIPRSPLYYIITSPLTALPGNGDRLAMMAFSSGIDALSAIVIGIMLLRMGMGGRSAVVGALLTGILSFGVLTAMSWGLFPTLFAQCWVLVAMTTWLYLRPRLHHRQPWLIVTAALTIAYLAYPTALLFLGLTWGWLVILLALRRDPATLPTLWATITAIVLALLLFYGWHLPAMLGKTLPTMLERVAARGGGGEPLQLDRIIGALWVQPYDKYSVFVLGAAAGGLLLLFAHHLPPHTRDGRRMVVAWLATYPLLAWASAFVVTFILKDVLYLLPLLALLSAVLFGKLLRRRRGKIVVGAVLLSLLWQTLSIEMHAVVYGFEQLK